MAHRFFRVLYYSTILVLSPLAFTHAQTQASCTFKLFKPAQISDGINDWGTTVGSLNGKAAIRYSGGSISSFLPPGAVGAKFLARNNSGVTVGQYTDKSGNGHSFMLRGSVFSPIVDLKGLPNTTNVFGINKWNSAVGYYADNAATLHGFKRYPNGRFVDLDFPFVRVPNLGQFMNPVAINDSGVVVGSYDEDMSAPIVHGFIYRNKQWAKLDVPNNIKTYPVGISNAGMILIQTDFGAFLYVNGKFKTINVPGSTQTVVHGMAPGGLIAGVADFTASSSGFVATCH